MQAIVSECLPRKIQFPDSVLGFCRCDFHPQEEVKMVWKTHEAPNTRAHFTLENFLSHGIINWINYDILPLWCFIYGKSENINSKSFWAINRRRKLIAKWKHQNTLKLRLGKCWKSIVQTWIFWQINLFSVPKDISCFSRISLHNSCTNPIKSFFSIGRIVQK